MSTSPADSSLVHEGDLVAGKYRVERVLGVGGMGVVVAATHIELEQRVALKLLLPETMQNGQAVERFLREARASVRLHSEHVAKVLDVGKLETGAPYMVMEYLDGKDLGQLVEESGALPVATAIDYLLQACEAIAEAHSLGIVHRDLKPQNLFLTRRVHGAALVKVLDFGISKAVTGTRQDMALTKTGMVMGSPLYMSPEQMKSGRLVDHRSDIWSLGVILYQLVTGQLPFDAETVPHLCALIMTEPARTLRDARVALPEGLQAVVDRCLDKDQARRFQNVAELAGALEPFASAGARGATGRISAVLHLEAAASSHPASAQSTAATIAVTTAPTLAALSAVEPAVPAQAQTATAFQSPTLAPAAAPWKNKAILLGALGALGAAAVVAIALVVSRSGAPSKPDDRAAPAVASSAASTATTSTAESVAPPPPTGATAVARPTESPAQPTAQPSGKTPAPTGKLPKTAKPTPMSSAAPPVAVAATTPPKPPATGAPQPPVPTDMFGDRK